MALRTSSSSMMRTRASFVIANQSFLQDWNLKSCASFGLAPALRQAILYMWLLALRWRTAVLLLTSADCGQTRGNGTDKQPAVKRLADRPRHDRGIEVSRFLTRGQDDDQRPLLLRSCN